jgi:hypothetical protein
MHFPPLGEDIVKFPQTAVVALVLLLSTLAARADPVVFSPFESLPWLKLGSTRQSDVVRAIGQPTAVIDQVRFRSEIVDRRSEYKALGITLWYLLDGEPDPKINQVLVEPPFQGRSSLGLNLGTGREQVLSKVSGLYKPEGINEPGFMELMPLARGYPEIDLWFANGDLSGVRLTHFLPPSERAEQAEAKVAELVKRDNLQDGFVEIPRCDFKFRINRRLDQLKQKRIALADSNVNWRLELFENGQSGAWTLIGYSKDGLSSSNKSCELASGDARGTQDATYLGANWYRRYFR